ncbi:hypothetical protein AKO1_014406 [Acrasis kona]|uniref:Uncharacterized protein n=1 Tax=Acrasis kona TaxID=1008807 RepID=A0AAW2Z0E6_9EUKA
MTTSSPLRIALSSPKKDGTPGSTHIITIAPSPHKRDKTCRNLFQTTLDSPTYYHPEDENRSHFIKKFLSYLSHFIKRISSKKAELQMDGSEPEETISFDFMNENLIITEEIVEEMQPEIGVQTNVNTNQDAKLIDSLKDENQQLRGSFDSLMEEHGVRGQLLERCENELSRCIRELEVMKQREVSNTFNSELKIQSLEEEVISLKATHKSESISNFEKNTLLISTIRMDADRISQDKDKQIEKEKKKQGQVEERAKDLASKLTKERLKFEQGQTAKIRDRREIEDLKCLVSSLQCKVENFARQNQSLTAKNEHLTAHINRTKTKQNAPQQRQHSTVAFNANSLIAVFFCILCMILSRN